MLTSVSEALSDVCQAAETVCFLIPLGVLLDRTTTQDPSARGYRLTSPHPLSRPSALLCLHGCAPTAVCR